MTKKPERDDDPVHDELDLKRGDAKQGEADEKDEKDEKHEKHEKDEKKDGGDPPAPGGPAAAALETGGAGPGAREATLVDAIFVNLSSSGGSNTPAALAQAFRTSEEAIIGAVGDSTVMEFDGTLVRIKPSV